MADGTGGDNGPAAIRQHLVADAILLERAAQAIGRRLDAELSTDPAVHAVVSFLGRTARQWREQAGQGLAW